MAGVNLLYFLNVFPGFAFVFLAYSFKFFMIKYFSARRVYTGGGNTKNLLNLTSGLLNIYFWIQFGFFLSFKCMKGIDTLNFFRLFVFYLMVLIFLRILSYYSWKFIKRNIEEEIILGIFIWFSTAIVGFFFISNLLLLLFGIELVAVIYYFFFLSILNTKVITLVKFKNLLSNYLWVSFFTLVLFFSSLVIITSYCGSLKFNHMVVLAPIVPSIYWHVLLLAFLWKIGAPGFYFFKLELYQFIPLHFLIIFSLLSVVVNCFVLSFFFINCWQIYANTNWILLAYLLVLNFIILSRGLKLMNFYQFLGLSAVNTWGVLLLMFLV